MPALCIIYYFAMQSNMHTIRFPTQKSERQMKSRKPATCIHSHLSIGAFAHTLRIGLRPGIKKPNSTGFFVHANFAIQSIGFARGVEFEVGPGEITTKATGGGEATDQSRHGFAGDNTTDRDAVTQPSDSGRKP